MTGTIQRLCATAVLILGTVGCGISIEDSAPLTFVAPLEGTWTLNLDTDVELRITIPGGQDLFATDFTFSAEIEDAGGTTEYDGTASGQTFELRDPDTGALVLSGEMLLESASTLLLSDGSIYGKTFDPDFTTGTWQDVNHPTRYYKFVSQDATTAAGCAVDTDPDQDEVEGTLTALFTGEDIDEFRVSDGGALTVRAPAFFYGASAMRIRRIEGFLHLQRVDRDEPCP